MFFFFYQSTDRVNVSILVIKYVVSLLNSTQKSVKVSKKLASLNSTIAILVKNIDIHEASGFWLHNKHEAFVFWLHNKHVKHLAFTRTT